MPFEFISFNFLPVVAVYCDTRKAMGKEKNDNIEFTKKKKKKDKIEIKFEINKELEWKYGKNWKVITMYLLITIIEIIVKMIVMLMNEEIKIIMNDNISK